MTKQTPDYGAVALRIIGKVSLDGGRRETLVARRENGTAAICALLLLDPRSTARHAVNLQGTALDRMKYAKRLGAERGLSETRYDAGQRFRFDWHEGGQQPNVTMRYEPGDSPSVVEMSDYQEEHYTAWRAACRALRRYADPVINCCCFDLDPSERGLARLLAGLDLLVRKVYS